MKVVWSDRALRSLAAIHEKVSAASEEATAHRVVDRILRRGDQLAAFPCQVNSSSATNDLGFEN